MPDFAPAGDLCGGGCTPTWVAVRGPTCRSGDSGGPLVTKKGPRQIVGIVAWNKADCNNPTNPGVYTRVSAFIGWIRKGMATTAAGGTVQFLDD